MKQTYKRIASINKWTISVFILFSSTFLITNCTDDEDSFKINNTIPVVLTNEVINITEQSAICGGTVVSDGGSIVIERGVVWSDNETPTILNNKTTDGKGAGTFSSTMTNLTINKSYYVRAYATNSEGTSYGSTMSFTTSIENIPDSNNVTNTDIIYGTMSDIEGNIYKTVTIDGQTWMAENLKTTKYNDGTNIPNIKDNYEWYNLTTGAYCNYDNEESNAEIYGRLYNFYAVKTGKIAPEGWRIPTTKDLTILKQYLIANGYGLDAFNHIYTDFKEVYNILEFIAKSLSATGHWELSSSFGTPGFYTNGNNCTGFSALPSGIRSRYFPEKYSSYDLIGEMGVWWLKEKDSTDNSAYCFYLEYDSPYLETSGWNANDGVSIRLIKNE